MTSGMNSGRRGDGGRRCGHLCRCRRCDRCLRGGRDDNWHCGGNDCCGCSGRDFLRFCVARCRRRRRRRRWSHRRFDRLYRHISYRIEFIPSFVVCICFFCAMNFPIKITKKYYFIVCFFFSSTPMDGGAYLYSIWIGVVGCLIYFCLFLETHGATLEDDECLTFEPIYWLFDIVSRTTQELTIPWISLWMRST